MQELKIFSNNDFGEIRTFEEDNKIWFCGADVAKALGYKDTVNTLKQHCKLNGVVFHHILTNGGKQKVKFISEGNLYRLITRSKLPSAEKFELWVFDEVLPTIRKTGSYNVRAYGTKQTSAGEVASLLKVLERQQKAQGSSAQDITKTTAMICEQFNIQLPADFVKEPQFKQLSLLAVIE